tara:strand:- start:1110 stop:1658 length:549 start_codon:yes stop_codon:yes gene_type:complete
MGEVGLSNTNIGGGDLESFKNLYGQYKHAKRNARDMSNIGKAGLSHAKSFKRDFTTLRHIDPDNYNRMLDKSNIGFIEKGFHKLINWGGNKLVHYLKKRKEAKNSGGSIVGGAMELHANEFLRNNGYKTNLSQIEALPHYNNLINAYSKGGSINVPYMNYDINKPNTYQAPYERREKNIILP